MHKKWNHTTRISWNENVIPGLSAFSHKTTHVHTTFVSSSKYVRKRSKFLCSSNLKMISPKMVKYYSMILIAGELLSAACCTPFMWNFRRKRVELTSGVQYFLYKLVWEVIFMISIIVTFRLFKALFLDSVEMFGVIIAVFYCTILWITVCIIALIVKRRGEFAQMVNTILKLDRLLKRKKIQMIRITLWCT